MGKIFVIMGKTSSGKDTIYKRVLDTLMAQKGETAPKTVVIYTTRPMRPGETNGVEYFFATEEQLQELREQGKVIEERCFHTVHGPWYYFTVNDGQIDLKNHSYMMINTLAGFEMIRSYYKKENGKESADGDNVVIPIYIEADPKDRLLRYINRESLQKNPNYSEVCRRFLADEADFAEEELLRLGIIKRYFNQNLEECCEEIEKEIKSQLMSDTEHPQDAALLERGLIDG
ncbi:MAG: guanylate kinase [Lachnospiraceae bacterium]|nr:guanylate kinase [Lachnospiraceae bacterium]